MISFITPDLHYAIPLSLNLTDVLDFSLAEFLLKKVKFDETHNWVNPQLDDEAFTVATDSLVTEEKDIDTGRFSFSSTRSLTWTTNQRSTSCSI